MYRVREWNRGDADRLLEAFRWNELAWQETDVPHTEDEALDWIARREILAKEKDVHGFVVVDGMDRALGHVQVSVSSRRHDFGWLSYWTHPAEQGRGVASAGARLATEFAFAELDLYRVETGHRVNNPGSCVAARRAGFRPEGIERAKLRYGTSRYDTGLHARLVTDPVEGVEEGVCGG